MIEHFERTARIAPTQDFLTFVNASRHKEIFSYRRVRMLSAFIAFHLQEHGVQPDDAVVVDSPMAQHLCASLWRLLTAVFRWCA